MIHARDDYQRIQDPASKIPEDEPVFLLRAQDAAAPDTLRFWAGRNLIVGGDRALSDKAMEHADLMERWQRETGCCKPADR